MRNGGPRRVARNDGTVHSRCAWHLGGLSKGFASPRPGPSFPRSLAAFHMDGDVRWKEGATGPGLGGGLLTRARAAASERAGRALPGQDSAESAPAAGSCGRRGGNKDSTCLGGARAGSALSPALLGARRASAELGCAGARDSQAAGLLLGGGAEPAASCAGGAVPRGGAGRRSVSRRRRRVRLLDGARCVEVPPARRRVLPAPCAARAEDINGRNSPARPGRRVDGARAPRGRALRRAPGAGAGARRRRRRRRCGRPSRGAGPRRLQNLGQKLPSRSHRRRRRRRRRRRARAQPIPAERSRAPGPRRQSRGAHCGGRGAQELPPAGQIQGGSTLPGSAPASSPGPPQAP
ncbi:splicing factor, arginine/serine-rich 19-like [Macaca nemestrina]|uniref:splicing factor, arginine/serine-rich 19-like n=1 Tax=Macaca nemestrina TaxID=9545 RepID=UPI0039B88AD6